MRRISLSTIVISMGALLMPAPAGATLTLDWVDQLGTAGFDAGSIAVAADAAGNTFVAGTVQGALPGHTPSGMFDAFVRKYDALGNVVWTNQFGSTDNDGANGVAVSPNGNVIVVGRVEGGIDGELPIANGDAFVREHDPNGAPVATTIFGTNQSDTAYSVSVTTTDHVLVAGETGGAFPGEPDAAGGDPFLARFDPSGSEEWIRQFGTAGVEEPPSSVATDAVGNAYVAGRTNGAFPSEANAGGADAFVAMFDTGGANQWTDQFGSGGFDNAAAADTPGSGVVIGGAVEGALPGQMHLGGRDAFLQRYEPSGSVSWTRQFGTGEYDQVQALGTEGGVILTGIFTSGALEGFMNQGDFDGFLRTFDLDGSTLETFQLATTGYDIPTGVGMTTSRSFRVAGATEGVLPGASPLGSRDFFAARVDGSPIVDAANRKAKEGDKTRRMRFPVEIDSAHASPVVLEFETKGRAKPGKDFRPKAGTITFPAGETSGKLIIKVKGDDKDEKTEKFTVTLLDPSGAILDTATGKIKDDD